MSQSLLSCKEQIKSLKSLVLKKEYATQWSHEKACEQAFSTIYNNVEEDLESLRKQAYGLLDPDKSVQETTKISIDLLHQWHVKQSVSLTALVCWALETMQAQLDPDLLQATLLASILGEVENNVPYHSNMHYRKVLLQTIRQIATHNQLFANTNRALGDEQIGLMLLAACAHDLGHDGTGNMVRGVFKQSRLELRSLNILAPYLAELGIQYNDPRGQAIKTMILSTDVTPIGNPGNPVNQMKAAYRFHYLGDKAKVDSLHLDDDFKPLQKDAMLTVMSLLLHEADIATSAGLSYAVTQYETIIYRLEVCEDEARPRHVLDFFKNICQRQFMTDAGQKLFGANFARIYAQVEHDDAHGNEPFDTIENCAFITGKPNLYDEAGKHDHYWPSSIS